jgi:signal peptidase I
MFKKSISVFVLIIAFLIVGSLIVKKSSNASNDLYKTECVNEIEEMTVQGNSLHGFVEDGQKIKAYLDYYECREAQREDVVLYEYAGNSNPLIKIVKAIPGDRFLLKNASDGGWNIIVNDNIVINSQGEAYSLGLSGYKILSMYERDYKGVIPESTYLIMGNLVGGSVDSSTFGLVHKSNFLAKVRIE